MEGNTRQSFRISKPAVRWTRGWVMSEDTRLHVRGLRTKITLRAHPNELRNQRPTLRPRAGHDSPFNSDGPLPTPLVNLWPEHPLEVGRMRGTLLRSRVPPMLLVGSALFLVGSMMASADAGAGLKQWSPDPCCCQNLRITRVWSSCNIGNGERKGLPGRRTGEGGIPDRP
jgi:hypothetical protein